MLTIENIILFILLLLLFMNFQTIVGGVLLYFMKLKDVTIEKIELDEIPTDVQEIIKPYESFLISKGFLYQSSLAYENMLTKFDVLHHTNYYYHEELKVHAFINTTPILGALAPATINFVTFYESYKRAISYDCFAYNTLFSDEVYLFDHYYGSDEESFKSHLIDREIEGEVIVAGALSEEGVRDYYQYTVTESIEEMIQRDVLHKREDGYRYSFSFSYLKYVHYIMKSHKKVKKILENQHLSMKENMSQNEVYLYKTSEERTLLNNLNQKKKEGTQKSKIQTFIISAISFILLFGLLGIPWSSLPILLGILLIHELGHYFAMKFYGYKDTSIFFIPLFGAAAKGEKEYTKPFEEYMVFLAGPLPGIILAIVIGILMLNNPSLTENAMLKEFAIMSFAINYINLLPIYPLDGGRIVQILLFTRYPKVQFYFFLVSLFVIIIAALSLKSIILGFFAVALFLSINHNHHLAQLLIGLKSCSQETLSLKEQIVNYIVNEKSLEKLTLIKKTALAKQALKLLNSGESSRLLTILGMIFYLLLLLPPMLLFIIGFNI